MSFGCNEYGQCGQGELNTCHKPKLIENLESVNIIQVACGDKHSLFLSDCGIVYACGDNEYGQIGMGRRFNLRVLKSPKRIDFHGPRIKKIGCGNNFSVLLDVDGNLYTFGCAEFGQLGM